MERWSNLQRVKDGNPLRSKQKKQKDISSISICKLTPIQMPHIDIDELKQGRKAFTALGVE